MEINHLMRLVETIDFQTPAENLYVMLIEEEKSAKQYS